MADCTLFDTYKAAREETSAKTDEASAACKTANEKQAALEAAQIEATDAANAYSAALSALESAERTENAAAAALGIDPTPPTAS